MRRARGPERSSADAWYDAAMQMVAVFPEAGLALGPTLEAWSEHGLGQDIERRASITSSTPPASTTSA